jgi:tetratricopeptide (TPR) repeat protein
VETVRMLLDRGALVQDGPAYRPTGEIHALEVPETLHALIAARLDGLPAEERRLLQDGAVLGKTFTQEALAAVAGSGGDHVDDALAALVRKEILGVQADPRSPEHGQYGFLQDLVRHVAYETLAKRDRRARHLAAAEHLLSSGDEDELSEVVASHYVAAYEAVPDADDAAEIKTLAREALVHAGRHAASLAAAGEARRYFTQAAELAEDPHERAQLLAEAGQWAGNAGDPAHAGELLTEAIEAFESLGDTHAAARTSVLLGQAQLFSDQRAEALARLERAFDVISNDEPDEALAQLAAQLSRAYWFSGDLERATARAELALDIAEAHQYWKPLVQALRGRGAIAISRGHEEMALALQKRGLELALEHNLIEDVTNFYFLLSDGCFRHDRYRGALEYLEQSLALARKIGNRPWEWSVLAEQTYPQWLLGRWDEVVATVAEFGEEQVNAGGVVLSILQAGVDVLVQRGDLDAARALYKLFDRLEETGDIQERGAYAAVTAALGRAEGRLEEALAAGETAMAVAPVFGPRFQGVKHGVIDALEAALALGETAKVEELYAFVDGLTPAQRPAYVDVHAQRLRARTAGDADGLGAAVARFRELEAPFWVAVTLLELAELTGDDEARAEAVATFEQLGARPWIARATSAQQAEIVA